MRYLFYISIFLLLSCSVSNRTVFQDDVYNNKVESNTISISSNSNDLYEDEYYMSNRNSFYNPYFLHRSRYGFCVVNNSFYNPYFWHTSYSYPYWTNRGWNSTYYNYGSWYSPYYNHNNYMWQGNNLTTYNQSYNQSYNSINTPRRSTISSHRGNPNTIGTTTPTYTRSSYTKSNNNSYSNHNRQPLNPARNVNNNLDNKADSYRRSNTNINNNRTNVRTYTPSTTPRTYTPSASPVRTTPTYRSVSGPSTTPSSTRTPTRRP